MRFPITAAEWHRCKHLHVTTTSPRAGVKERCAPHRASRGFTSKFLIVRAGGLEISCASPAWNLEIFPLKSPGVGTVPFRHRRLEVQLGPSGYLFTQMQYMHVLELVPDGSPPLVVMASITPPCKHQHPRKIGARMPKSRWRLSPADQWPRPPRDIFVDVQHLHCVGARGSYFGFATTFRC